MISGATKASGYPRTVCMCLHPAAPCLTLVLCKHTETMNMVEDEYLTTGEVAKLLKFHPETVWRLIWEKKLPSVRVGDHYRVRRQDLDATQTGKE
jgi:excisionase family DNA binding protein